MNLLTDQGLQDISYNVAFCPVGLQLVVEQDFTAAGLHTGFSWTSWGSSQPLSPACQVLWKTGLPLSCQLPFHLVLLTKLQGVHPSFCSGPEYINPTIWNVFYDLRKGRLQSSLNSPFTYLMEWYSEGGPDYSELCYGMICLYLNNSILSNVLFESLKMFSAFWSFFKLNIWRNSSLVRKYIVLRLLSALPFFLFPFLLKYFDPYSCHGLLRCSDFKGIGQMLSALLWFMYLQC